MNEFSNSWLCVLVASPAGGSRKGAYRTGLLWKLFMSCPEIQKGLKELGFESPQIK